MFCGFICVVVVFLVNEAAVSADQNCGSYVVRGLDPETGDDIFIKFREKFYEKPCGPDELEYEEEGGEDGQKRHLYYNYIEKHWEIAAERPKCKKEEITRQPWAISTSSAGGRDGLEEPPKEWVLLAADKKCKSKKGKKTTCPKDGTNRVDLKFHCKSFIMGSGFMDLRRKYFDEL